MGSVSLRGCPAPLFPLLACRLCRKKGEQSKNKNSEFRIRIYVKIGVFGRSAHFYDEKSCAYQVEDGVRMASSSSSQSAGRTPTLDSRKRQLLSLSVFDDEESLENPVSSRGTGRRQLVRQHGFTL